MRVVLASSNAGKLRELASVLAEAGMEVLPQSEFGITTPPEDACTFVENALIKARHAAGASGMPAIADDSGLEVDLLDGAPGVYSARYAGDDADDAANNRKLLAALEGTTAEQRTARYRAVLVFLRRADDPAPVIAQGTWGGRIANAPRGETGFGYDPLFELADGRTAAQLAPEEKNRISHRARALSRLHRELVGESLDRQ